MLEAVIEEAERREVQIHRVSQGSGSCSSRTPRSWRCAIWRARPPSSRSSSAPGPRGRPARPLSPAQARSSGPHRGQDQLAYALEDVLRGVSLGLRGVLVADAGLLWVPKDLKARRIARGPGPEGLCAARCGQCGGRKDHGGPRGEHATCPQTYRSPNSPRYAPLPSYRSTCTSGA